MGGLLTTFEQKKKISSLLIAYGNEVTNDPTRFEQEIWRQMALKQETFNINNLSRKLTSMEFRDKNNRKYFSGSLEIHIAVYKININAFENHLSGVCLITDKIAIVIVEGCCKSQYRYYKLMIRRINWNLSKLKGNVVDDKKINEKCDLLWHGEIQAPAFNRFRTYKDLLDTDIKQFLREHRVEHYWELANRV